MHLPRESDSSVNRAVFIITFFIYITTVHSSHVQNTVGSPAKHSNDHHRIPRAVHEIFLSDPLDCLSQLVCGLNTFPPQVPTPRTSSANDYAYLLQHVVLRLKKQKTTPITTPTTTTTTPKPADNQQDDDDEDSDDDIDNQSDESLEEDTTAEKQRKKLLANSKDQNGDVVEMKGLYPPLGTIEFYRRGRARENRKEKPSKTAKDQPKTKSKKPNPPKPKQQAPRIPTTQSPLQLLRREQDIRQKLKSNARCLYGILDHTCPFKYSELLILMSAVLERQKVISYTTNKILPMAGYLLKSRSLTQTMKSTFFALERINNITLANADRPTFTTVYDEIIRGEFPENNGIHLVETRIDAPASSHVFEDDEFDAALKMPFLPVDKIPGYAIKERNKKKKKQEGHSEDNSKEEESVPDFGDFLPEGEGQSEYDYDENNDSSTGDEHLESKEDIPLPSVYGSKYRRGGGGGGSGFKMGKR